MSRPAPESPFQVYLAAPADVDAQALARLLAGGRVASLLLHGAGGSAPPVEAARRLTSLAHGHGVPLVIARDAVLAREVGADGVHIAANERVYAAARQALGDAAIVGAGCGVSRHDALVLAELGADYVAFGAEPGTAGEIGDTAELAGWWQEVCEPPVVAWHVGGWDDAAKLIETGADFIGVEALVWQAEAPEQALDRLTGLIAEWAGS